MARKFKFPEPKTVKLKDRAALCTADRMLNIYNQLSGKEAKRISKTARTWFATEAPKRGWAGVHFLPEVWSGHSAGCVLFIPPQKVDVTMKITKTTLVLTAEHD